MLTLSLGGIACEVPPRDADPCPMVSEAPREHPDHLGGVLVAHHQVDDREGPGRTWVHGVFSRDAQWLEPDDPLGLFYRQGFVEDVYEGHWTLPEVGETLPMEPPEWDLRERTTVSVGDTVSFGEVWEASLVELEDGFKLYTSEESDEAGEFAKGGWVPLELSGNDAVPHQVGAFGVDLPAPLVLGNDFDPEDEVLLGLDEDLELSWSEGLNDGATVVSVVASTEGGLVQRVHDADGQLTWTVEELDELGTSVMDVTVLRLVESEVPTTVGTVAVRAQHATSLAIVRD